MRKAQAMRSGKSFLATLYSPAKNLQIFGDAQVVVERKLLRHVSDVLANAFRVRHDVDSRNLRVAGRWAQQSAKYADGRGFAGAVRAQKTENFAAMRLEADVVHGDERSESLGQMFDLDRWRGLRS